MTEARSEPRVSRRANRLPVLTLVIVLVIVVAVFEASRINLNYYVLSPGDAQPVGPLIKVPPGRANRIDGAGLVTVGYRSQVTARR
jgi:PDZ domain-containing secreted protein